MGFQIGDWAEFDEYRVKIAGFNSKGKPVCEAQGGALFAMSTDRLKPLPGCTGWDWTPEPEPADSGDVVYVCISVKRSVWDAVGDGEDIPAGAAFDGVEMVEIASMPGARLFLLLD